MKTVKGGSFDRGKLPFKRFVLTGGGWIQAFIRSNPVVARQGIDMPMNITSCAHRTLDAIVMHADGLHAVTKSDLEFGDLVLVTTAHSTYSIYALEDGFYSVSGGWFDRHGLSPMKTTITGCTWGGSAVKLDIMAACGLHLEFGNRVITSRIRSVQLRRCQAKRAN